jgi:hypothetical protein
MFRALRQLFERLAEDGPLVLAFNSLQEADEARSACSRPDAIDRATAPLHICLSPAVWRGLLAVARCRAAAYRKDNVEIVLQPVS